MIYFMTGKSIARGVLLLSISFLTILVSISCEKLCIEKRNKDCACFTIYDPVCGCNDKTYSNSCKAECAGITEYSEGTCE
ncbi:MAG: Kazal-type serine protease inhibitor family protein [Salibacter sp.]|uniref:Kazal-type serine protease inhibitor family protein n=1 Tax=Salibacter sp. TaxID=2010995 RepID=UPI0028708C29|nr:Kazal-type serine protease inhibitor family protein [Salibacter sp.]MDR9398163.1 Kazal-type serine protease inhibitor family protein [Salibacter sp.]